MGAVLFQSRPSCWTTPVVCNSVGGLLWGWYGWKTCVQEAPCQLVMEAYHSGLEAIGMWPLCVSEAVVLLLGHVKLLRVWLCESVGSHPCPSVAPFPLSEGGGRRAAAVTFIWFGVGGETRLLNSTYCTHTTQWRAPPLLIVQGLQ